MVFCLVREKAHAFRQALRSGKIDPARLAKMSSEDRRAFFDDIVGKENSTHVNTLFESKLLLKNQQQGMITWAKQIAGMSPRVRKDLIQKIESMDTILKPDTEKAFLEDLASHKLGTRIGYEEAKTIADLSENIRNTESKKGSENKDDRLEYGRAVVELNNYVSELKKSSSRLTLADIKRRPLGSLGHVANEVAGNLKAIQASLDNSAIFRQGWKTMWTNPGIWQRNARKSFQHLIKMRGQESVMNELNADIVSRPTYDMMKKAKLDVGNLEEAFPTTLPEKVPVLGRVYKATENAYTAFVQKTRADVFDKYIDIAQKAGVELTDQELRSIGRMVNTLTGRGGLGRFENAGKVVNNVFFSPKFVASQFQTISHAFTGAKGSDAQGSAFVRKQAAINLIKITAGTAAILAIANQLKPGSVEADPRSSDFGKIRVGNTRFDVTGGMGSLVTLASRLLTRSTKSSVSGKISDLANPKHGEDNTLDVLLNFGTNKLSPVANVVKDLWFKPTDFDGNPNTPGKVALNAITPLPIKNAIEVLQDPSASNAQRVAAIIADSLGISTNTYSSKQEKIQNQKGSIEEMLKAPEIKKWSAEQFVPILKEEDLSDDDRKRIKIEIRRRALGAQGRGTLTPEKVQQIKEVYPEFDVAPRVKEK